MTSEFSRFPRLHCALFVRLDVPVPGLRLQVERSSPLTHLPVAHQLARTPSLPKVAATPVRPTNTLVELLAFHILMPSLWCAQRDASSSVLVVAGPALLTRSKCK